MEALSPLQISGIVAVAIVVLSWLLASFLRPGPGQDRAAWLGTLGLYLALSSLFVSLYLGATGLGGRIGFGFLAVLFCGGLIVSTVRTLASLRARGGAGSDAHATH